MGMFHAISVGDTRISPIDWEMNPDLSFGTFESWGGRERVRNNSERIYYFFVDAWEKEPKLCLMERGVKHAKVLAEINAPAEMVRRCVAEHGWAARFEQSFAINSEIRDWLIHHVLDDGDASLVVPVGDEQLSEDMGPALPQVAATPPAGERVILPAQAAFIQEEELGAIIRSLNFYEAEINPGGSFAKQLVAGSAAQTVVDLRTGLMWQCGGLDINSLRVINRGIEKMNRESWAGFSDWRLPTLEEALSLMEPLKNSKGLHLHPCFSKDQPFIFVAAQRKPGGCWFVDYKQGRVFWSSGTIPGGFARLVRNQ